MVKDNKLTLNVKKPNVWSNKISKAIGVIVKARSLARKKGTPIPILQYDVSLSDVLLPDLGSNLYI